MIVEVLLQLKTNKYDDDLKTLTKQCLIHLPPSPFTSF